MLHGSQGLETTQEAQNFKGKWKKAFTESKGVIIGWQFQSEKGRNSLHNKEEENRDDNLGYRQHVMQNYGNRSNERSDLQ